MATARDYFDYLSDRIDIAPANSQEEVVAASTIADIMTQHGLETTTQDFDAPAMGNLMRHILIIMMFVGIILSAVGKVGFLLLGIVLTVGPAAILILEDLGQPLVSGLKIGPGARSQNVIGYHPAEIDPDDKNGRQRPIVILAHYDTPRTNVLRGGGIVGVAQLIRRFVRYCVPVVAAAALLRILLFLPGVVRIVFLVIGIIASLPLLAFAVTSIIERFAACTDGANDNKSGVAAMLAVLNKVRPADDAATGYFGGPYDNARHDSDSADPTGIMSKAPELPAGVRRGVELIESLGILPATCEVSYSEKDFAITEPEPEPEPEPMVVPEPQDLYEDDEEEPEGESTAKIMLVPEDEPEPTEIPGDPSGLNVYAPEDVLHEAMEDVQRQRPAAVDDPNWGKSTYQPTVPNIARRAALFDLPDPAAGERDPFGSARANDASRTVAVPRNRMAEYLANASAAAVQNVSDAPRPTPAPQPQAQPQPQPSARQGSMSEWLGVEDNFDARSAGRSIGSWDNFDSEDDLDDLDGHRGWKGGAAIRSDLRIVSDDDEFDSDEDLFDQDVSDEEYENLPEDDDSIEDEEDYDEDEQVPTEDELRDAILSMDDSLRKHDIWFVAAGASELDHAGVKAFLSKYRTTIRGAFLFNLDSVGAGTLSILTQEGLVDRRRSDRRTVRLLSNTASDLNITLDKKAVAFDDTDATPAMRSSVRAVTISGLGTAGVPAYSHTLADVTEVVDVRQVEQAAELVAEVIRRS